MKKVIVTGGAGFIGSNLVKELVNQGYDVTVIDNLYSGKLDNLSEVINKIKFVNSDITDKIEIQKDNYKCIFHLAAIPSVNYSLEDPVRVNEVNVAGTLKMLQFARENGIKKFVYSASSAAYGEKDKIENIENMLPDPLSPYGVSKLVGEYYCRVFYKLFGIDTISLRYFNVFGPGQSPDSEYAAVIPKFIFNTINNKKINVFGDGEQTRDFTFVKDIVRANIKAMNTNTEGNIVNIATGKSISLNFLLNTLKEINGNEIDIDYLPERKGDIKHSFSKVDLAKKILDFECCYSFEHGIKETYRWFLDESDF